MLKSPWCSRSIAANSRRRSWKEEASGAVITDNEATLNFSSPEQTATLRLSHKYDLTTVSLVAQVKEAALAARAKAKKEADEQVHGRCRSDRKADDGRGRGQARRTGGQPVGCAAAAVADSKTPVPLPESAENVEFNGDDGKLEFDSSSSVKALATFYRQSMKSLGWKEQPSVINKSNMVVMEFSKGGKELSFTAMQMGPKVNVTADGSGLVMANAKPDAASDQAAGTARDQNGVA